MQINDAELVFYIGEEDDSFTVDLTPMEVNAIVSALGLKIFDDGRMQMFSDAHLRSVVIPQLRRCSKQELSCLN